MEPDQVDLIDQATSVAHFKWRYATARQLEAIGLSPAATTKTMATTLPVAAVERQIELLRAANEYLLSLLSLEQRELFVQTIQRLDQPRAATVKDGRAPSKEEPSGEALPPKHGPEYARDKPAQVSGDKDGQELTEQVPPRRRSLRKRM